MYNQQGGVLGKKIKLIMEDIETKKDVGLAKARRLVEREKVHYLTGVIDAAISMAVQGYVREKKIVFVNSGSGNDMLIKPPNCDRYFFKAGGSVDTSLVSIRVPSQKIGPKWYFLAENSGWGKYTTEAFKKAIKHYRAQSEVVGEDYTTPGETNFAPYVTKIMAAKPDGLLLAQFGAPWFRSVKQVRDMGLKCHIHHAFWSDADAQAAGDAVVGVTTSVVFLPENPAAPRAAVFSEAFKKKHGRYPGYFPATGFNGVECLVEAIKASGSTDTETVIEAMEKMKYKDSVFGPDVYFRKADHMGITGVYTVEAIKDPKYLYGLKVLGYEPNPTYFLSPEDQTGCGEHMKKKS
jgi:branched-chain amino acid transport system substrate-binding protein